MPRFKSNFKQLLLNKAAHEGKPITQRQAAEDIGVSLPAVSRWYRDEIDRLEIESVSKIIAYFQCKLGDLVELVED